MKQEESDASWMQRCEELAGEAAEETPQGERAFVDPEQLAIEAAMQAVGSRRAAGTRTANPVACVPPLAVAKAAGGSLECSNVNCALRLSAVPATLHSGDWRILFNEDDEVVAVVRIASRGSPSR